MAGADFHLVVCVLRHSQAAPASALSSFVRDRDANVSIRFKDLVDQYIGSIWMCVT